MQRAQERLPSLLEREEAEIDEGVDRESAAAQTRKECRGSGDYFDLYAALARCTNERVAWIADPGCAGVGNKREVLPGSQTNDVRRKHSVDVVRVEGEEVFPREAEELQEPSRHPRVLAHDGIARSQRYERPLRDIPEIADGSGNNGEHVFYRSGEPGLSATPPTRRKKGHPFLRRNSRYDSPGHS